MDKTNPLLQSPRLPLPLAITDALSDATEHAYFDCDLGRTTLLVRQKIEGVFFTETAPAHKAGLALKVVYRVYAYIDIAYAVKMLGSQAYYPS